jgi:hypothetical protein
MPRVAQRVTPCCVQSICDTKCHTAYNAYDMTLHTTCNGRVEKKTKNGDGVGPSLVHVMHSVHVCPRVHHSRAITYSTLSHGAHVPPKSWP